MRKSPSISFTLPTALVESGFVCRLLDVLRNAGQDVRAIVAAAGVRIPKHADLKMSVARLSQRQIFRLFAQTLAEIEADARRREGVRPLERSEYEMLWYCVINCATLREAIERAAQFCAMLDGRFGAFSLRVVSNHAFLRMDSLRVVPTLTGFCSDIIGLGSFLEMFGWLIGGRIDILGLRLAYSRRFQKHMLPEILPFPAEFEAPRTEVEFPAEFLDRPVIRSYQDLLAVLPEVPIHQRFSTFADQPISERVRGIFESALARDLCIPTLPQLCTLLHQSPSTLRRRLQEVRTSIGELKQATRRTLALRLLSQGHPLKDIAERLGFSDIRAFRRAFRKWNGTSPAAFQRQKCDPPHAAAHRD